MLSEEARDLAKRSTYPDVLEGIALQYEGCERCSASNLQDVFSAGGLKKAHPELDYKSRFAGGPAVNAAFALEAMKRNLVRCVSFAIGGFDTHGNNYRGQAQLQQETFGLVSALVKSLDATPHPTLHGAKLSEHTHILVVSDFCRTPQINLGMGRDHYPNNSALVVSPRFRRTSRSARRIPISSCRSPSGGSPTASARSRRPISSPRSSGLSASSPRKYMRDGEIVRELLRA
jgi:hypothetical protein